MYMLLPIICNEGDIVHLSATYITLCEFLSTIHMILQLLLGEKQSLIKMILPYNKKKIEGRDEVK